MYTGTIGCFVQTKILLQLHHFCQDTVFTATAFLYVNKITRVNFSYYCKRVDQAVDQKTTD